MDSAALNRHNTTRAGGRSIRGQVIRGLLYQAWLALGRPIMVYAAVWVIGGWVLAAFTHPWWYVAWGILVVLTVGSQLAKADIFEGTEEFAFALPATRLTRYMVRFGLGLGILLVPIAVGLLAVRFSVPQALWGLLVESGFTESSYPAGVEWYARALVYPAATFAILFALTVQCQSRTQFSGTTAGVFIGLYALITFLEAWLRPRTLWWVPFAILVLMALAAAVASAMLYARKEGVSRPVAQGNDRRWAIVFLLIGVLAFLILLGLTVRMRPSEAPREPENHETTDMDGGL